MCVQVWLCKSGHLPFTFWPTALGEQGCPGLALNPLPVLHGSVAQENMNSKPIVRPDVSSSTQGVQALVETHGRQRLNTSNTQETSLLPAPEGHEAKFQKAFPLGTNGTFGVWANSGEPGIHTYIWLFVAYPTCQLWPESDYLNGYIIWIYRARIHNF